MIQISLQKLIRNNTDSTRIQQNFAAGIHGTTWSTYAGIRYCL